MSHEEVIKQKVKDAFKAWDVNDDGIISKNEMKTVLLKLLNKQSSVSEEDIEAFMKEADQNDNGVIEYDEFLEWVLRPGAKLTTTASGKVAAFDLEGCLRPLYDVYDKNGDGQVSWEEFEECYCILANSLSLSVPKGANTPGGAPWMKSADEGGTVFQQIDTDHDKWVSFKEFCQWQREALANSGLHSEDLKELIPNLARQLSRVYKLSEGSSGEVDETDEKALQRLIDNIAATTRDLWNTEKAAQSALLTRGHFTNRWTEPPIGLNIQRLVKLHMKLVPGMMLGVEKLDLEVVAIPQVPDDVDTLPERDNRLWLAQIVQIVTLKTGKVQKENPSFYIFKDMQWKAIEEDPKTIFTASISTMAPELRVFCALKTEANFGMKIKWDQILKALLMCVDNEWMTKENFDLYNQHMESLAVQMLQSDARNQIDDGPGTIDQDAVVKKLEAHVKVPPRSVMAKLSELGIFEVSSVWADFMD